MTLRISGVIGYCVRMSFAARTIRIPHRHQRQFAHAADIYRTTIGELGQSSNPEAITCIHFDLRKILGSDVSLQLGEGDPAPDLNESIVRFSQGLEKRYAVLRNSGTELSLHDTYSFDEVAAREALAQKDGAYFLRAPFHESNIHMLLSPIKYILTSWPLKPEDARVVRIRFARDVQALQIEKFHLRVSARRSFSLSTYTYEGRPIGEVTHYFLDSELP